MISLSIFTVKPCFLRDQEGWQPLLNVTIGVHISPRRSESRLYLHCNYESVFIPRVTQTRNPGTCSLPAWVWGALMVAQGAKVSRSGSLPRSCLHWVIKNKSCYLKVLTTLQLEEWGIVREVLYHLPRRGSGLRDGCQGLSHFLWHPILPALCAFRGKEEGKLSQLIVLTLLRHLMDEKHYLSVHYYHHYYYYRGEKRIPQERKLLCILPSHAIADVWRGEKQGSTSH